MTNTVIVSGLLGNKLVTQGYGAEDAEPTPPTVGGGGAVRYYRPPKRKPLLPRNVLQAVKEYLELKITDAESHRNHASN